MMAQVQVVTLKRENKYSAHGNKSMCVGGVIGLGANPCCLQGGGISE